MRRRSGLRVRIHGLHDTGYSFARGQGDKKTVLIIAIAGVVIAIAATAYFVTTGNRTDRYYDEVHWKCTACGHEFTMAAADVAKVRGTAGDPRKRMMCPACNKEAGEEEMRCEKCGKWFLAKPSGDRVSLKCIHCGYDPDAPPTR